MANLINVIGGQYNSWLKRRQLLKLIKKQTDSEKQLEKLLEKYPEVKVYHVSLTDLVERFGNSPTEK